MNPGEPAVKRSRRRAMLVTLTVVVAGMALPSNVAAEREAAAGSKASGCPGVYCLWTKRNFNGQRLVVDTRRPVNMPNFMNNKASSLKSRLCCISQAYFLFDAKNGNGPFFCENGSFDMPNLANNGIGNAISSTDVGPAENC